MAILIPVSTGTQHHDVSLSVQIVNECEQDQDPFPPAPDPCGYLPGQNPEIVVTGYMGASMAAHGYVRLGGKRMTATGLTGTALLPNCGLAAMQGDHYVWCQAWHSPYWSVFFEPQLGQEEAVWGVFATTDDEWRNGGAGAIRPRFNAVLAKIRTYTDVPVFASVPPNMSSAPTCKSLLPEASAATWDVVGQMASEGLLALGPVFPPPTAAQKLNRCRPNYVGEQIWGQVLLDFFG